MRRLRRQCFYFTNTQHGQHLELRSWYFWNSWMCAEQSYITYTFRSNFCTVALIGKYSKNKRIRVAWQYFYLFTNPKKSSSKKSWNLWKVATWHRSGSVLFSVPLRNQWKLQNQDKHFHWFPYVIRYGHIAGSAKTRNTQLWLMFFDRVPRFSQYNIPLNREISSCR